MSFTPSLPGDVGTQAVEAEATPLPWGVDPTRESPAGTVRPRAARRAAVVRTQPQPARTVESGRTDGRPDPDGRRFA